MVSPNDIAIKIFGNRDIIWLDPKDPISFMEEATELWNQTIDILNQKLKYQPLCYQNKEGQYIIEDWVKGFVEGIFYLSDFWNILLEDEDNQELLRPIITLYNSDKLPLSRLKKKLKKNISKSECIKLLNINIPKIYEYFSIFRNTLMINQFKFNRKEMCFCGSGKKYKECCIDNITLH